VTQVKSCRGKITFTGFLFCTKTAKKLLEDGVVGLKPEELFKVGAGTNPNNRGL